MHTRQSLATAGMRGRWVSLRKNKTNRIARKRPKIIVDVYS